MGGDKIGKFAGNEEKVRVRSNRWVGYLQTKQAVTCMADIEIIKVTNKVYIVHPLIAINMC